MLVHLEMMLMQVLGVRGHIGTRSETIETFLLDHFVKIQHS